MFFITDCSKVRRNSFPTVHKSLPFCIVVSFLLGDESDMSWHAILIIKLPFVFVTKTSRRFT